MPPDKLLNPVPLVLDTGEGIGLRCRVGHESRQFYQRIAFPLGRAVIRGRDGCWFTIPDNKTWHTANFRLEAPQFVHNWGFNFSLESDGNTYNRYSFQSVEVRKVNDAGRYKAKAFHD